MKKGLFKRVCVLFNMLMLLSYFINVKLLAIDVIGDPMLLKALNNSIAQFFPNRGESEEILEADVPYVLRLDASGLGISDISGLEQFVYIQSTIDLSNNNIIDITPLMNWVKNKNDENLNANIFLGGNPILYKDNYKQIYKLAQMGEHIKIYDSQRNGEGVVELTGFVNGRPADEVNFDDISSADSDKSVDINQGDDVVDTGIATVLVYILSCLIILIVLWKCIYRKDDQ